MPSFVSAVKKDKKEEKQEQKQAEKVSCVDISCPNCNHKMKANIYPDLQYVVTCKKCSKDIVITTSTTKYDTTKYTIEPRDNYASPDYLETK